MTPPPISERRPIVTTSPAVFALAARLIRGETVVFRGRYGKRFALDAIMVRDIVRARIVMRGDAFEIANAAIRSEWREELPTVLQAIAMARR